MINNDWERFGDEIRRTIQDAVDNQDFRRLNQTVTDTIGRAMGAVSDGLRHGGWYREPGAGGQNKAGFEQQNGGGAPGANMHGGSRGGTVQPRKKMLYLKGTAPKAGGIFLAATGYTFGLASLVVLFILCLIGLKNGWGLGIRIAGGLLGASAVIFAGMAFTGTSMVCSVGRFRNYVKLRYGRAGAENRPYGKGCRERSEKNDTKGLVPSGAFG